MADILATPKEPVCMEKLPVLSVIEKSRLASDNPYLALLAIEIVDFQSNIPTGEKINLVRNNESIVHMGVTYEPCEFDFSLKSEAGSAPSIDVTIVDFSRAVQNQMENYGGGVGCNVTLSILNRESIGYSVELEQKYKVVSSSVTNYVITWELGSEDALAISFPRRRMLRDRCSWRYKDPATCGYVGPLATCDLSLKGANGCDAHGNEQRFGGFPSLTYQ